MNLFNYMPRLVQEEIIKIKKTYYPGLVHSFPQKNLNTLGSGFLLLLQVFLKVGLGKVLKIGDFSAMMV